MIRSTLFGARLNHELRGRTLRRRERTNGRNPTQTGARQFAAANRFEKSGKQIEKSFECQFRKLGRQLKDFNSWKQIEKCPGENVKFKSITEL